MPQVIHQAGNSLAVRFPGLAEEWYTAKNGYLTPYQVTIASHAKIWWTCPIGPDHEWRARVADRTSTRRSGCPCCAGKKLSVTNSLATVSPGLAAQWHPTKNGSLTPDRITVGSNRSVWWRCPKAPGHEWYATNRSRRYSKGSCPFCSRRRVSVTNSLETQAPDVAAQWHPLKNGSLTPRDVVVGSNRRVWWRCPNGVDHEWQALISNRTRINTGCPYCAGKSARLGAVSGYASIRPARALSLHGFDPQL